MIQTLGRLAVCLLVLGCAKAVFAQQPPPAPDPPKEPMTLKQRMQEPDQGGGLHFTEHWAVAFGGIKQGSAIALGPAFSTKFKNGAYVQLKAVYSIKKFRLLQARYDTGRFWTDRAVVVNRVRWQDAPELTLYRLGMGSSEAHVDFGERKTEVSTRLNVRLRPRVLFSGGFGVERFGTDGGRIDLEEPTLPPVPVVPGLATHPWFAHSIASIAVGTLTPNEYSRTGYLVGTGVHDYRDTKDGQHGFQMYEAGAQQLVPTFGERGVLDLSGRTWLTHSSDPRFVPFYLMPTLGGGDFLRAFPTYRFRDREAWFVKAEYRWAVHKMADVAGLYEGGKVAPEVKDLDFTDMAHSVGLGIRVHSKKANLFRADIAHGREGWGFRVGFNAGGS